MNVIPRDAPDCQPLEVLMVPLYVARCCCCGAAYDVEVIGYDTYRNGRSEIVEIQAECENEDIEDEDDGHDIAMPYVDLLPIHDRIIRWLNKNFVVEE